MNLESILKKTAKPFVIGGAVTYMFFNILAPVGCAKLEPVVVNPPVINPPTQTDNYTPAPSETPVIEEITLPEPILPPEIVEPYQLYAPTATPEEFSNFNSALEKAWGIVKNVYGMDPAEPIAVVIAERKQGYWIELSDNARKMGIDFNNPVSDSGSYPIRDFLADQEEERGIKHELAHRFNETLFPTYHSWFDEGLAMYVSGEVESGKLGGMDFRKDDGTLETYVGNDAILNYLISNPNKFWERLEFGGVSGHLTGLVIYWLLEHEGLTPEKNKTALEILANSYAATGVQLTKDLIQTAYQTALDKDLGHVFDIWLKPGIMKFYSTDPAIAGTKGAEINKTIRSEFSLN